MHRPLISIQSCRQNLRGHSKFRRPLAECHSLVLICNASIAAGIILLLQASSPFTISFAVGFVIINSLYGMRRRWHWSHVSNESRELSPFFTDCNTSSSIVFIVSGKFIEAALTHSFPHMIFRCFSATSGIAMFKPFATAIGASSIAEVLCGNIPYGSAGAKASPIDRSLGFIAALQNGPFTKNFINQIVLDNSTHGFISNTCYQECPA